MGCLTFIDKQTIQRLFNISGGYIFYNWNDYTKNITKEIIYEASGINIYEDKEFNKLSQQKCIEKIWNEYPSKIVANVLEAFYKYFTYKTGGDISGSAIQDYKEVGKIIQKLHTDTKNQLSINKPLENLKDIVDDIQTNISKGKPEMALDRLHTYAIRYLRDVCVFHEIKTTNENGKELPLHSLIGNLKKWYEKENYFESEFSLVAIQSSISIFEKFNSIRNNHSAAHANELLNKTESEYAIQIIDATLSFIEKIENLNE